MTKLLYFVPLVLLIMISLVPCHSDAVAANEPVAVVCAKEPTLPPASVSVPCPVTDAEIVMIAQTMYEESQILYWWGNKWGVSYIARQAAVGWCILNRYDIGYYGSSVTEILSSPNQFAWRKDAPVTDHFLWLAQDIVDRWWAEKQGSTDVGRTLPSDYLYFCGDGQENHFRKEYLSTETWNWSYADPYEEVPQ